MNTAIVTQRRRASRFDLTFQVECASLFLIVIQNLVKMAIVSSITFSPMERLTSGIIAKISYRTLEQRTIILYIQNAHIMVRDTESPSLMVEIANRV